MIPSFITMDQARKVRVPSQMSSLDAREHAFVDETVK